VYLSCALLILFNILFLLESQHYFPNADSISRNECIYNVYGVDARKYRLAFVICLLQIMKVSVCMCILLNEKYSCSSSYFTFNNSIFVQIVKFVNGNGVIRTSYSNEIMLNDNYWMQCAPWGSYGRECEDCSLMGCDVVWFRREVPILNDVTPYNLAPVCQTTRHYTQGYSNFHMEAVFEIHSDFGTPRNK
jgi:hypothetical protein